MRLPASVFVVYAAAVLSPPVWPAAKKEALEVRVGIRNPAHLEASERHAAESAASAIFRYSGIYIHWTEEPDYRSRKPGDEEPMNATLSFVTEWSPQWSKQALGVTHFGASNNLSAVVLVTRVLSLAENFQGFGTGMFPKILGHVAAHELGHVLMRSDNHCASGLMRASWESSDLLMIAHNTLRFTDQQSALMRANILALCKKRSNAG